VFIPTCRAQIQAEQPKENSLTELRKDMGEANRRLTSHLEAFQDRLLKKVEDMMHRGPEAKTFRPHSRRGHRSSGQQTESPPQRNHLRHHQTPNRELNSRHKINQQGPRKRRTHAKSPREGKPPNKATRLERRKTLGHTNRQMHH